MQKLNGVLVFRGVLTLARLGVSTEKSFQSEDEETWVQSLIVGFFFLSEITKSQKGFLFIREKNKKINRTEEALADETRERKRERRRERKRLSNYN